MISRSIALPLFVVLACEGSGIETSAAWQGTGDASTAEHATSSSSTSTSGDDEVASSGDAPVDESSGGVEPEVPPEPADGAGVSDPASKSLHNACGGLDWQRIHGWLLTPHAAPEIGDPDELARCVSRYAGWVTNEADLANVSRASVYAALAASGQCDETDDYDGTMIAGAQCVLVHPDLDATECSTQMAESRAFGIATLAAAIGQDVARGEHDSDPPRIGAWIGHGAVECGGDDRWKLQSPAGFVDRYVAAYNAYKAQSAAPPSCSKRIVVSVALYTGLDTPGEDGVTAANGCWTYERVAKENAEWKICNYDGTVHHENGFKWAYDDTNTTHGSGEADIIRDCQNDVAGRGFVYMTNRGNGWPKRVTEGVEAHFAEIYSGQYAIDDQFSLWKAEGSPGEPMIHLGEASTSASEIDAATRRSCDEVADGRYLGVYVYPESLRGDRMSAMVEALNACTE